MDGWINRNQRKGRWIEMDGRMDKKEKSNQKKEEKETRNAPTADVKTRLSWCGVRFNPDAVILSDSL